MIEPGDLQKLQQESSGEARAEVARKVAQGFVEGHFSQGEKRIAAEIFRLLLTDAEVKVRQHMSTHLAQSMDVPHDIIFKLATDVTEVAVPVLLQSYVLSEDDLIAITRSTQDVTVMSTIARRDTVSRDLSEALLHKSNLTVTQTLLGNKSATIDERDLGFVYDTAQGDGTILELLVKRGGLPVTLAEKMFVAVSDELKKMLTQQYKLSVQIANDTTKEAYELATLGMVGSDMQTMDISKLIDQLYLQGRLTLSIIIRSLCLGDMRFFEHAMAKLADIPVSNVQLLVLDQGEHGFKSLYKTSCLPMEMFSATNHLLKITLEETSFGRYQRNDFKKRLADRLSNDDSARNIEYMDYLVTLVQNNVRDAAFAN